MAIPKKKRVTLATVAQHAGVSVTTVSVVLSGREEMLRLYNPATVAKVKTAAEKLGYQANLFATGLPTKRSPFFAFILQDLRSRALGPSHLIGYEAFMLAGVISAAMERRLYPITAAVPPDTTLPAIQEVARIIDGGACGAIVQSPNKIFEQFLGPRYRKGHPIVAVFPRKLSNWSTNAIDVDNLAIGRTAATLLAARNRRRWALVRYEQTEQWDQLRCKSFIAHAHANGQSVDTIRLPSWESELRVRDYVLAHLKNNAVDAVFAPASTAAVGSLLALIERGMKPTEDFDLIGCDCAAWHESNAPSITCVDISWEAVGIRAVEELARMREDDTSRFRTVLMKPRITPAGTCPVPDDMVPEPEITVPAPTSPISDVGT